MTQVPPTPHALPKEFQNALSVCLRFESEMASLEKYSSRITSSAPLLTTNFMASSREPLLKKNIPRHTCFYWAQSCPKAYVVLPDGKEITFRKINARKRGDETPPSMKIWLFDIYKKEEKKYFLWCERGVQEFFTLRDECCKNNPETLLLQRKQHVGILTDIGRIFPEALMIEQFSFLAPFVDKSIAHELGWKTNHLQENQ